MLNSDKAFIQGYNAQAAVDAETHIIVAVDLTGQAAGSAHLKVMLRQKLSSFEPQVPSLFLAFGTVAAGRLGRSCWGRGDPSPPIVGFLAPLLFFVEGPPLLPMSYSWGRRHRTLEAHRPYDRVFLWQDVQRISQFESVGGPPAHL